MFLKFVNYFADKPRGEPQWRRNDEKDERDPRRSRFLLDLIANLSPQFFDVAVKHWCLGGWCELFVERDVDVLPLDKRLEDE
jgi:hypothetical protein